MTEIEITHRPRPDRPSADGDLHVMPTYGREHQPSSACWCRPGVDRYTRRWRHRVWAHREQC